MLEAFRDAKRIVEEKQKHEDDRRAFESFVRQTRLAIETQLGAHRGEYSEKNFADSYQTFLVAEGFATQSINAQSDLQIPESANYWMNVFIGRERKGAVATWFQKRLNIEPRMVVDVEVSGSNNSRITRQIFFIGSHEIKVWNGGDGDYPTPLPHALTKQTELVSDVLQHAGKTATITKK